MLPSFLRHLTLLGALSAGAVVAQEARIEQARQRGQQLPLPQSETATASPVPASTVSFADDNSFGLQQILKRREKLDSIRVFGDVTGFATDNAALTRRERVADYFLVASFGAEYRRVLPYNLQFESTVKFATFRYEKLTGLSFESVDAGAGLSYHAAKLWGTDFSLRYNFTDLIGDDTGDTFFKNHSITLAAQKTHRLSQAQQVYAGAAALFGFSDPKVAERDEYSLFAGYHLQATQRLDFDLLYRYAYYRYAEFSRADHNHGVSLSARYTFNRWLSVFGSGFLGYNRSNREVFNYDVANGGVGLGVTISF